MRQYCIAAEEQQIRDMAERINVTGRIEVVPVYSTPQNFFSQGSGLAAYGSYNNIVVDLIPGIRGTPEGQLIAEIILRDAYDLARIED